MEIAGLVEQLRCALARHPNVRFALLFGSRARETARPESDVDLAIEGEALDVLALAAELEHLLGQEVDVVDVAHAGYPLVQHLLRDGIPVYEARRGAAADWRARALVAAETDRGWYERMREAWLARVALRGL